MKFKVFLIFLLLSFFLALLFETKEGFAQEKKLYTLEQSVSEAMENNWSLKAVKEKVNQAIHVRKQARAEFLPKLSTTYGYTRLSEVKKSDPTVLQLPAPIGTVAFPGRELNSRDNYQWKGTVTQPIFTGFALISSYRLAKLGIDQSEMEVDLEKLDLALRVKEAYFGILEADKFLDVAEKAIKSLESHVKVARSFYKVGMIPINDLLKAEVELANAEHDVIKAGNASLLARAAFNAILSRDINDPVDVVDILGYEAVKGEFRAYLEKALQNRPEMKLLEIAILQVDQQVKVVRSRNYPEVALTYDYIKEGDDPDVSGSAFHDAGRWQAMVRLSWTFWEWGATHYSIKEKEGLRKELIKTRSALEDSISLEVKNTVLTLKETEENIPTTRKAVEQAEENLRVSEERYKAQVTTSTEVLDAQTLLTQARTNYYSALYDHHLAKARLLRSLGRY